MGQGGRWAWVLRFSAVPLPAVRARTSLRTACPDGLSDGADDMVCAECGTAMLDGVYATAARRRSLDATGYCTAVRIFHSRSASGPGVSADSVSCVGSLAVIGFSLGSFGRLDSRVGHDQAATDPLALGCHSSLVGSPRAVASHSRFWRWSRAVAGRFRVDCSVVADATGSVLQQ